MNELALFAGAGGGVLAAELLGIKTVCGVEINPFCVRRLLQRQNEGYLPFFPVWDDVCTFNGSDWKGIVDVVSGGFPCQAFSTATHGKSTARNFWPEMFKIIGDVKPKIVFAENVSFEAIGKAAKQCESIGYRSCILSLSASDLGADHHRGRFWFLAYTDMCRELFRQIHVQASKLPELNPSIWSTCPEGWVNNGAVADERQGISKPLGQNVALQSDRASASKSPRARMVDGVASRMDRYYAIGNGQVPAVAAAAFLILMQYANNSF